MNDTQSKEDLPMIIGDMTTPGCMVTALMFGYSSATNSLSHSAASLEMSYDDTEVKT